MEHGNQMETKKTEWTWTVDAKEEEHGLTGITPDSVCVLHEVSVPAGYTMQSDVFFHTNKNGLGIDKIWFDPAEKWIRVLCCR